MICIVGKEACVQCRGTGQTEVQYLQIVESAECVPQLVKFCLYQPKRRRGTHLSVSMVCESAVRHCYWRQPLAGAACGTGCVSVWCLCVSVCLQDMCSALLRVGPAKGKAAAVSSSLSKDPRSPGTRLGPSAMQEQCWAGAAGGDGLTLYLT